MADNVIQLISVNGTCYTIHRLETYPVHSVIHPSNNRGQEGDLGEAGVGVTMGTTQALREWV